MEVAGTMAAFTSDTWKGVASDGVLIYIYNNIYRLKVMAGRHDRSRGYRVKYKESELYTIPELNYTPFLHVRSPYCLHSI